MKTRYLIEGWKWFDSPNGNTYHSVRVSDLSNDKVVVKKIFVYGYGNQWEQTGYDLLIKENLVKEEDRFNHELNRKRFKYIDYGYGLKRDIKNI